MYEKKLHLYHLNNYYRVSSGLFIVNIYVEQILWFNIKYFDRMLNHFNHLVNLCFVMLWGFKEFKLNAMEKIIYANLKAQKH